MLCQHKGKNQYPNDLIFLSFMTLSTFLGLSSFIFSWHLIHIVWYADSSRGLPSAFESNETLWQLTSNWRIVFFCFSILLAFMMTASAYCRDISMKISSEFALIRYISKLLNHFVMRHFGCFKFFFNMFYYHLFFHSLRWNS